MPARMRPIRWELLLNPAMAGLREEARSNAQMHQSIMGGLVDVGRGITAGRRERESQRRFDEDMSLRRDALDFRQGQALERDRERQANDTYLLDQAQASAEALGIQMQLTGQGDPATAKSLQDATQALGGPEAAQQRIQRRTARPP